MDYEARVSKVEAQLETNQKEFERLHQVISELRKLILERSDHFERSIAELRKDTDQRFEGQRNHTDQRFEKQQKYIDQRLDEQRKYIDQRLDEQRKYIDQRLDEQRKYIDQQFEESRKEAGANMRWIMTMWLTTIGLVASMGGRILGIY